MVTVLSRNKGKGFSLIELMIVIMLLGILTAIIMPNISKFADKGVIGTANSELATVRTAIATYQSVNNQNYPCDTQPEGSISQPVNNSLISPRFVTGSIKGIYYVSSYGSIVDADNGTWPDAIYFDTTDRLWKETEL